MKKNERIEKYNSFIHKNLKEFVETLLSKDINNRLSSSNRCKCPFHLSKDNDFAYNGRFGYWRCFGRCNQVIKDSFSLVQKLFFPVKGTSKEEWLISYRNTCKLLDDFIDGRDCSLVVFQREEQMNYTTDVKIESIFQLLSKKYIEKNSIFTPEYIRCNIRKWFKIAEINRFDNKTIKAMKIFETTNLLPKEMFYLSYFWFYMLYDDNGRLVGFQGRRKDDENVVIGDFEIPKMYNLKGFDKSKVIYNLNNCIKENNNSIVILEGPGDVARVYELFGVHFAISLMGGELSPYQIYLLKKYYRSDTKITVMLDNDAPGRKYAKKVIKKLLLAGFTNIAYTHVFNVKDAGALKGEFGRKEFATVYVNSIEVGLSKDQKKLVYFHLTDKQGKTPFLYLVNNFRRLKKECEAIKE